MGDKTFVMVNGPSHLGANFGLEITHLRFLASSHTLSPSLNGVKERWVLAAIVCWASLWVARVALWAVERVFRHVSIVEIEVSEIIEGRAWGSYPIMR